jgi:hypothetical protein
MWIDDIVLKQSSSNHVAMLPGTSTGTAPPVERLHCDHIRHWHRWSVEACHTNADAKLMIYRSVQLYRYCTGTEQYDAQQALTKVLIDNSAFSIFACRSRRICSL